MKLYLLLILCVAIPLSGQNTQMPAWPPSGGQKQIQIWPGAVPDARAPKAKETAAADPELIAGKQVIIVRNVSQPTMTVYPAKGKNTGAAVLVFPGGGYEVLAIDLEGTEACDWLTSKGITCVLLKYRVPAPRSEPHWGAYPQSPIALEDAQRAMGLVRLHAAEWHIDPHKFGVLGFSAGGHLVAAISTHYDKRLYPQVDAADKESCRPDFGIAVYPGHLWLDKAQFVLNPNVPVTAHTPPTFLLQDEDDHVDNVNDSLVYYLALKKAGVPVEMHLYAQGGHAFGLRRTKLPVTAWPQLVETWLRTIKIISE